MILRILLLTLLPLLSYAQINSKEAIPKNTQSNDKGPVELKRNALYNLEEIKVRWKKAALENCPGVPCVVTPPAPSFTCGTSTISDIDNNVYSTVSIGTQCWTKENLKVTMYNDGTLIPDLTTSTSNPWAPTSGARTEYVAAGVTGYVGTFGYLYNWYAATDSRKLCPAGWHVPTDSDLNKLVIFIHSGADTTGALTNEQSTTAGDKLKKNDPLGTTFTGTDDYGFSALPGGVRDHDGSFNYISSFAFVWSATQTTRGSTAWNRYLYDFKGSVDRDIANKSLGSSVRCLRD